MSERLNFYATDDEAGQLRLAAGLIGHTLSDTLRRMIDHCLRVPVFNEAFPLASGCWPVRVEKRK